MFASASSPRLTQALREQRVFLWCLLVSIALHALLLLGLNPRIALAPPEKALLVLTARLAPLATGSPAPQVAPLGAPEPAPVPAPPKLESVPPPKPAQTPPEPEPVSPPKATLAPSPKPVTPAPAPKPPPAPQPALRKPLPKPVPNKPAPAAAHTVPRAPAADASAPAAAGAQPVAPRPAELASLGPGGAGAPASSEGELDKGLLEQYRLALIAATGRYKRYPAIAMEKGWQGRVEVHLVIGANGMLASASIKASSGHRILDKQALDMLRKGKTTVRIPAGLRGREFGIDVPVIFNLDDPRS